MTDDKIDAYRGLGAALVIGGTCIVGGSMFGWLGIGIALIVVGLVFAVTAMEGEKTMRNKAQKADKGE